VGSSRDVMNAEDLGTTVVKKQCQDQFRLRRMTHCHGGADEDEQQRHMVVALQVSLSMPRENKRIVCG